MNSVSPRGEERVYSYTRNLKMGGILEVLIPYRIGATGVVGGKIFQGKPVAPSRRTLPCGVHIAGQHDGKGGPLSYHTVHRDVSLMCCDNFLHDVEP